jgi:hypothetical protein
VNPEHLFLGTHADNMADMVTKGRQRRGATHHLSRLTAEDVREIRRRYVPFSRTDGAHALGREFGVHRTSIQYVIHGRSWKSA